MPAVLPMSGGLTYDTEKEKKIDTANLKLRHALWAGGVVRLLVTMNNNSSS